jgi:hypothetical protein
VNSVCPDRVNWLNDVLDGPPKLNGLTDSACLVHHFRLSCLEKTDRQVEERT